MCLVCLYVSVALHCQLDFVYWNEVWLAKAFGTTVVDTNPRVGWLTNRNYSSLVDSPGAKVGLRVRGRACETISLSYSHAPYMHVRTSHA